MRKNCTNSSPVNARTITTRRARMANRPMGTSLVDLSRNDRRLSFRVRSSKQARLDVGGATGRAARRGCARTRPRPPAVTCADGLGPGGAGQSSRSGDVYPVAHVAPGVVLLPFL